MKKVKLVKLEKLFSYVEDSNVINPMDRCGTKKIRPIHSGLPY